MTRLDSIARQIRRCRKCRLGYIRNEAVPGEGRIGAFLFFVGEAPGRLENLTGRPFVGQAGKLLDSTLSSLGIERRKVFITSVNKCRPPNNRKPRVDEVAACRHYLAEQIDTVKPRMIVALGLHSLSALTTSELKMSRARKGEFIYHGTPLVATYHPAAVLYNRRLQAKLREDLSGSLELAKKNKPRIGGIKPLAGRTYVVRVSSGGVPWDGGRKFLLIRRMEEGLWGFPKGGVENSEALEAAAIREIEEETGLKGSIVCLIQSINYSFYKPESDINFNKTVYYFLVKMRKGEIRLERGFEDHRWCNYSDGMQLLHYENDRVVLRSARDAIRRLS